MISNIVKNSILVKRLKNAKNIPVDCSKIGGKPYLPKDFIWPTFCGESYENGYAERPLSFLCQINIDEVKHYDKENLLPEKGMLYFFYELDSSCWGFDTEDKGCARVYYYENTDKFKPLDFPENLNQEFIVKEYKLMFDNKNSCPSYEELDCYLENDMDWDKYDECLEEIDCAIDCERNKLLGYADLIQGECLTQCERIARGLYCGDHKSYVNTPTDVKEDINRHASDWTLLFQMMYIQEKDFELLFGDCGNLYFYIKRDDLINRNFDDVWLILQCG